MKKKQRGRRRKCAEMVRLITERTQVFPRPHMPPPHMNSGYWHLHLPVTSDLLDSANTPFGVRLLCVQTLMDRAQHLANIAPIGETPTRVVVLVTLPKLWESQIIVFFGSDYFDKFFDRNTTTQRWTRMEGNRSVVKDWNIQVPGDFSEIGYDEEIQEQDYKHTGENWFIGQLTPS